MNHSYGIENNKIKDRNNRNEKLTIYSFFISMMLLTSTLVFILQTSLSLLLGMTMSTVIFKFTFLKLLYEPNSFENF